MKHWRTLVGSAAGVAGVLTLAVTASGALRAEVRATYARAIAVPNLLEAATGDDQDRLRILLNEQGLGYQRFRGGRVVASDPKTLPRPRIITIRDRVLAHVLAEDLPISLTRIEPYVVWVRFHPRVVFPLIAANGDIVLIYVPLGWGGETSTPVPAV